MRPSESGTVKADAPIPPKITPELPAENRLPILAATKLRPGSLPVRSDGT